MATYIDMSLEDIIKRKKKVNKSFTTKNKINKPKDVAPKQKKLPVSDARLKIISNKRKHITDAREKLAELAKQKDARLKLEHLRSKRMMLQETKSMFQNRHKLTRTVANKERVFIDPSRQVVSQPIHIARVSGRRQINSKRFLQDRITENRSHDRFAPLKPILRTVENDIEIIDDPMGEELQPTRKSLNRKASLQLKIVAHNNNSRPHRSGIQRTATIEREKSPPRPPSILKKRPMAALQSNKKDEITEKPLEYRIIISNLRNTVTSGDIEELFGDVGEMMESRLVRPGTAEVIYKSQDDAQRAVDLYHNRQLDGQPMTCLLVTPRSNATSSRNSTKPALYSTNSNVEPDISTFHKVLFSNF